MEDGAVQSWMRKSGNWGVGAQRREIAVGCEAMACSQVGALVYDDTASNRG
jgi:hypothetical protein